MDHDKLKEMFFKFWYRIFCLAVLIFCNRQIYIKDDITWGGREMHTVLVKNPEGKRLLRRCKGKLEDNLKVSIGGV